nr:MAG TPA: tail assembly chaperone protein [Bacteriophage sp.]
MKTGKIKIKETEYITCFSTRVLIAIEEREGDSTEGLKRILNDSKLDDLFWLLAQLIDAGARYAKMEGLNNPEPLTKDELIDMIGVDEYPSIFGEITQTVISGNTPNIETKPLKNAETTPKDE